jgi:hypothetical protein
MRPKKRPDAEPIRLGVIEIYRRKVLAYRSVPISGPAHVAAVFNATEIEILKRVAAGEWFPGVHYSQDDAIKELAWVERGGRYLDDDEDNDEAS